jgi:hypothetical protein
VDGYVGDLELAAADLHWEGGGEPLDGTTTNALAQVNGMGQDR